MRRLHFTFDPKWVRPCATSALLREDEDPATELIAEAWRSIAHEVEITVGGVTMHAAAWEDPDHWASDWVEKLGVDYDEVQDAVRNLLEGEITDG